MQIESHTYRFNGDYRLRLSWDILKRVRPNAKPGVANLVVRNRDAKTDTQNHTGGPPVLAQVARLNEALVDKINAAIVFVRAICNRQNPIVQPSYAVTT